MYNLGEQFKVGRNSLANPKSVVKGDKYRFTVLTERLIRMEYSENGIFEDRATENIFNRKFDIPKFEVIEDARLLTIATDYFKVFYLKNESFKGTRVNPASNLKIEFLENIDVNRPNRFWYYGMPEVKCYGAPGFEINSYKKVRLDKGLFSLDGFVTIDDSKSMIIDDDGVFVPRQVESFDIYLFVYLNDFSKCLEDYYKITGYTPLLPRYALGNWWYRNYKYGDDKLDDLIVKFKENKIPISSIILNHDWHVRNEKKNVNTGFTFNTSIFSNPKETINKLHQNGIKVGLTVNPFEGFTNVDSIYSETVKYLLPDKNGIVPFNVYDPKVIDVYLKFYIHQLDSLGVDFYFIDYASKEKLKELSILKHYQYYDMMRYAGRRPLIYGYNSCMASHRYSVLYSGANVVDWNSLKEIPIFNINSTNIGVSWWSHDIGGFHNGIEDNELFIRFVQLGVFSPILKLSSDAGKYYKREPWRWDVKTYDITKDYLQLRHRLIPYIYSEAYRLSRFGTPLLYPLYYTNPQMYDDPLFRNEYYFGSELFVSPILNGKDYIMDRVIHKFYIPDGVWYDFITGKKFPGNRRYVSFFKDQDYPVFVKMGSIIPMSFDEDIFSTLPPKNMEIQIFPGKSNNYIMYEDDGETNLYLKNNYVLTSIDYNYMPNNYTVIIRALEGKSDIIPSFRNYKFVFRNTKKADDVTIYRDYESIPFESYVDGPNFIVVVKNVPTFGHQLTVNCKGNDIEIDAVRLVNKDIEGILSDLQIKTEQKEQIDKIMFSDKPVRKKRIAVRRLKKVERKFIQLCLKLLEYVEINDLDSK
jgi:alpha-glucosidase (family GH31 glycosyl hydrolase)